MIETCRVPQQKFPFSSPHQGCLPRWVCAFLVICSSVTRAHAVLLEALIWLLHLLISEKQLLPQLPWPLHSLGRWKAVVEARADVNHSPGGDVHTHPERRSCLWSRIWTRHVIFLVAQILLKNFKNMSFPYAFEGALETWLADGLEVCLNTAYFWVCLSLLICLSLDLEYILSLTLLTQVKFGASFPVADKPARINGLVGAPLRWLGPTGLLFSWSLPQHSFPCFPRLFSLSGLWGGVNKTISVKGLKRCLEHCESSKLGHYNWRY